MIITIIAITIILFSVLLMWLNEKEILKMESLGWLFFIIILFPVHMMIFVGGICLAVFFARNDALFKSIFMFFTIFVYGAILCIIFIKSNIVLYRPLNKKVDKVHVDVVRAGSILGAAGVSIVLYQLGGFFYMLVKLVPDFMNPFSQFFESVMDEHLAVVFQNVLKSALSHETTQSCCDVYIKAVWIGGIVLSVILTIHAIVRIIRSTPLTCEKTMIRFCVMLWIPGINLFAVALIYERLYMIQKSYRKVRHHF